MLERKSPNPVIFVISSFCSTKTKRFVFRFHGPTVIKVAMFPGRAHLKLIIFIIKI